MREGWDCEDWSDDIMLEWLVEVWKKLSTMEQSFLRCYFEGP